MSRTHVTVIALAFIAGCAGSAVAKLIVPPARAQSTPRWEYLVHVDDNTVDVTNWQKLGAEGWEYAGDLPFGGQYLFKRPLP